MTAADTLRKAALADDPADLIREARDALGMSQETFADEIGATRSSVDKWERGMRDPGWKSRKAWRSYADRLESSAPDGAGGE